MKTYTFSVIVEPDDDQWFAYCPLLEDRGAATHGATEAEARKHILEVVEMTVESMIEHGELIPEPKASEGQSELVTVTLTHEPA